MDATPVLDGQTLLALLQGADHVVCFYELDDDHTIEEIAGCVDAAMQDAGVVADLPVVAEAVRGVQDALRPPPSERDLIGAGFALIGGDEWDAHHALSLLERARDQLAAVVALAMGLDPHGDYAARRLRRCA